MKERLIAEIEWQPAEPGAFNPNFSGYDVGHYSTGHPEQGWCLYCRAGGCWNQRTKAIKPPEPGAKPERIDGKWWWVRVTPAPDVTQRPPVSYVMILPHLDGYQLHVWDKHTDDLRYRSVKPTLDEVVEDLSNWMKGVIVW